MAKVTRIHEYGDPSVLQVEIVDVGAPGRGEVRLRQEFIWINYVDTHHTGRHDHAARSSAEVAFRFRDHNRADQVHGKAADREHGKRRQNPRRTPTH